MSFATVDQLNWNVISRDLTVQVDGESIKVPFKKAQLRDDTHQVIGVTGKDYQIFQNSDLKDLVMPAVEEGLLTINNIGYLGVGGKVFIQAEMAESFTMAGEEHRGMITLMNSHDGTSALAAGVTDTRVICGNTFAMAMGDMSTRLRHGKNLHNDAAQITAIMDFVNEGMRVYSESVEALATTRCDESTVRQLVEFTYGKPAESVRATNNIIKFFRNGAGNEGRTLYDAVNGFTEYFTHKAGTDDNKRFVSTNFGRNAVLARKAFRSALAMV